jgi:uncharacterized protein
MSQPFKLYRLQQIDSQLDQAHARLNEIDAILSDNATLRQAKEQNQAAETGLEAARKALRHAENEVQSLNIKIGQSEASLYGGKIHNPKELQDLEKEIASMKKYITVLEDRQLEQMLAVEEAESAYKNSCYQLDLIQAQVSAQQSSLVSERDSVAVRVASLEGERQATSGGIDPVDLKLYEQLRIQRRGVAVARISDNACSACGSTLTPGQVQAARSPLQLSRCTFCGRILYAN